MGFYARYLGPRVVRCLCSMDDIRREREKVVPAATGIGPGLNLPLYDPPRSESALV